MGVGARFIVREMHKLKVPDDTTGLGPVRCSCGIPEQDWLTASVDNLKMSSSAQSRAARDFILPRGGCTV